MPPMDAVLSESAIENRAQAAYNERPPTLARSSLMDAFFRNLTRFFAAFTLIVLAGIIVSLIISSWPAIQRFGLGFLWSNDWNPPAKQFGALVPISGPVKAAFFNAGTEAVENAVKISHRNVFNADVTKEMLGIAKDKLAKYKDMASFLGAKKAKDENIVEYFNRIFPSSGKKEVSRNAERAMEILHTQPGANYAEGTWWQPFNAITFLTDHELGRNADSRLTSAWYGYNKGLKTKALELAVEMAEAA